MSVQSCLRIYGDLDDSGIVGKDGLHHTFFQMLGSCSIGGDVERRAIGHTLKLLTEVYGFDTERLYVTYLENPSARATEPMYEAQRMFVDGGIPQSHLVPRSAQQNFWMSHKVGLRSQRFKLCYDRIGHRDAAHLVNCNDESVIAICSIVLVQHDRSNELSQRNPTQCAYTELGVDRLLFILQGRRTSYDTELFTRYFEAIHMIARVRTYQGTFGAADADGVDAAYRLVADYSRTLVALFQADVPATEDPYRHVLRRLIWCGARCARKYLNAKIGTLFSRIMSSVLGDGTGSPRMKVWIDYVTNLMDEEERMMATSLERGEAAFLSFASACRESGYSKLPGDCALRLHTIYGIPIGLTILMAREQRLAIDVAELEKARQRAHQTARDQMERSPLLTTDVPRPVLDEISILPFHEDERDQTTAETMQATIIALLLDDKSVHRIQDVPSIHPIGIVLDRTNLLAKTESQDCDVGSLVADPGNEAIILSVKQFEGRTYHFGYLNYGSLAVGDKVFITADGDRKRAIQRSHTATHILEFAIRQALDSKGTPKASFAGVDTLTCSFAYPEDLSNDQIEKIEKVSKTFIEDDRPISPWKLGFDVARRMDGLKNLLWEDKHVPVPVVLFGAKISDRILKVMTKNPSYQSTEVCGQMHSTSTGALECLFVVELTHGKDGHDHMITAVTGKAARNAQRAADQFEKSLRDLEQLEDPAMRWMTAQTMKASIDALQLPIVLGEQLTERLDRVLQRSLPNAHIAAQHLSAELQN